MEIYDGARDDPLRAFGLGYLAHLAADSVAHNYFVPKQLAVTSSTSALGHSYWESRFETHLGHGVRPARARADSHRPLALRRPARPRAESDDLQHADQSPDLSRHGDRRRQRIVAAHLPADEGKQPLGSGRRRRRRATSRGRTTSSSICCMRMDRAEPFRLDPSGDEALRHGEAGPAPGAARGRRTSALHEEADRHFGMPSTSLTLRCATRAAALRSARASASN